jgi:hypothetical protein
LGTGDLRLRAQLGPVVPLFKLVAGSGLEAHILTDRKVWIGGLDLGWHGQDVGRVCTGVTIYTGLCIM